MMGVVGRWLRFMARCNTDSSRLVRLGRIGAAGRTSMHLASGAGRVSFLVVVVPLFCQRPRVSDLARNTHG